MSALSDHIHETRKLLSTGLVRFVGPLPRTPMPDWLPQPTGTQFEDYPLGCECTALILTAMGHQVSQRAIKRPGSRVYIQVPCEIQHPDTFVRTTP